MNKYLNDGIKFIKPTSLKVKSENVQMPAGSITKLDVFVRD